MKDLNVNKTIDCCLRQYLNNKRAYPIISFCDVKHSLIYQETAKVPQSVKKKG